MLGNLFCILHPASCLVNDPKFGTFPILLIKYHLLCGLCVSLCALVLKILLFYSSLKK